MDKDRSRYIGAFVGYARLKLGLTQHDISDDTGYSVQTVSKLENGHGNPLSYASREIFGFVCSLCSDQGWDVEKMFDEFCSKMEDLDQTGYELV